MTFRQSTQLGSLVRLAPVLALTAGGCSLLVPVQEYVGLGGGGGMAGGSSGFGQLGGGTSTGGLGGASVAGGGATGGTRPNGGSDETGGSEGGADNAGAPGPGGMAGEEHGGEGPAQGGTSGVSAGGMAGTSIATGGLGGSAGAGALGGRSGSGGTAGTSGMAGSSGAGAAGCGDPDFMTDPKHCGSCENACDDGEKCLEGYCASSPCDGLCTITSSVTIAPGAGYKAENIGGDEVCAEVIGYDVSPKPPSIVCWNFQKPRFLQLNGTPIDCAITTGQEFNVPPRMGGYCVHAAAGTYAYRGFEFPE